MTTHELWDGPGKGSSSTRDHSRGGPALAALVLFVLPVLHCLLLLRNLVLPVSVLRALLTLLSTRKGIGSYGGGGGRGSGPYMYL